jgi:hypothetical protein
MLGWLYGNKYALRRFPTMSRSALFYWKNKFESGVTSTRGGARNWLFNSDTHALVEGVLWMMLEESPLDTPAVLCDKLHDNFSFTDVTTTWVHRMLVRWHYTRKKVYYVQKNKFTIQNTCRYVDHILAVPHLDPTKLKFLDESRFETRRVRRHHGYSARGQPIIAPAGDDFRESFSFTLVILLLLLLAGIA